MDKLAALDKIEDGLDVVEAVEDVVLENKRLLVSVFLIASTSGVVIGMFAGYKLAKRVLEPKYIALADKEIEEAKLFYARLNEKEKGDSPAEVLGRRSPFLDDAVDAIRSYQGDHLEEGETDREPEVDVGVTVNVFTDARPEVFDLEHELKNRTTERPYIISHEEFMVAEPGFEQVSFTYYAEDDMLADARDQPIPLVDEVIGEDNLRFGYGSDDDNTVFVRNEKLAIDFEITKSTGSFAGEVMGLQHSARNDRRDGRDHRHPSRESSRWQ
jgi:hypothetical protein